MLPDVHIKSPNGVIFMFSSTGGLMAKSYHTYLGIKYMHVAFLSCFIPHSEGKRSILFTFVCLFVGMCVFLTHFSQQLLIKHT